MKSSFPLLKKALGLCAGSAMMASMAVTASYAQSGATNKIMLVFDSSGSMRKKVEGRSRMASAKQAVSQVMGTLDGNTEIGLVAYGHRRGKDCSDMQVVAEPAVGQGAAVARAVENMRPLGETPIADAVRMAAEVAAYDELPATVVLVTDGEESCGGDPCALADELEQKGQDFTAHVIGFGYGDGEVAGAACLAQKTGGQYIAAADASQLADALVQTVSAPVAPSGVSFASDDFDGEGLSESWEVLNPDDEAYLVEDGVLLASTSGFSYLGRNKKMPNNVFTWNGGLPSGDFDVAVDFKAEFAQSTKAIAEIGLYTDQKNAVVASLWRSGSSNNGLWLQVMATQNGKNKEARLRVATGSCCPRAFNMDEVLKQVEEKGGKLILQRRGRKMAARLELNGWTPNDKSPSTFTTDEVLVLRPKGKPAIFGGSWGGNQVNIVYFDRFEIKTFE
ncbi:MAG: VWA domain-containing protein [Pseudomonadota bacterium]